MYLKLKCLGESRTWCQTLWFGSVCIYISLYLYLYWFLASFFYTCKNLWDNDPFFHQLYIWATSWIWGPVHLAVPLVSCQCHGMAIGQWKCSLVSSPLTLVVSCSFRLFSIYDDHKLNPHRACWLNHQDWCHPCDEVLPLGYLNHSEPLPPVVCGVWPQISLKGDQHAISLSPLKMGVIE